MKKTSLYHLLGECSIKTAPIQNKTTFLVNVNYLLNVISSILLKIYKRLKKLLNYS